MTRRACAVAGGCQFGNYRWVAEPFQGTKGSIARACRAWTSVLRWQSLNPRPSTGPRSWFSYSDGLGLAFKW